MKTSTQMSPVVLMAMGMGALIQTRLRYSLDGMSSEQRKLIRLPHVGAKEIARYAARVEAEILEKNKGVYIV